MGKLKTFLVIVLSIAIIGTGATFLLGKEVLGFGNDRPSAEDIAELSVDTDIITTNLASNNFGVVQFNILLDNKDAKEELDKRKPEVRAAIISTLAGFTKDQLVGRQGIINLEEELLSKLQTMVETGMVERVLVTEFKVQ